MKPYKISPNLHLFEEHNFLRVDNRVLLLSDVKKYLLTYHERLCNQFKVRSYVKDDKIHCHYAWDSIITVAYSRFILQDICRMISYSN
jgi:hypothetical protein